MTTRFRRYKRFARGKKNYVWASIFVTADAVLENGVTDGFPIVTRDDWARDPANGQSIEKGAVVQRIIGNVRMYNDTGVAGTPSAAGSSYIWGIGRFDEDDSNPLSLITNFFAEDWMRMEAGTLSRNVTSINGTYPHFRHDIDMTVKRKLTTEDEIRFHFGGFTGAGGISATERLVCDYFFRTLIAIP